MPGLKEANVSRELAMGAIGLMLAEVAGLGINLGIDRPVAAANGVLDPFKCYDALGRLPPTGQPSSA